MNSKNRIVVITDCNDVGFNEIRASIVCELEKIGMTDEVSIEPPVYAKEFSLINGAFLTRLIANDYPPKTTTLLVIINPLKTNRKDRARLIGETLNGFKFVGENTGTLSWLIKDMGIRQIFESSRQGIDGKAFISFGGKYIHAPIAARLASGLAISKIGHYFDKRRLTKLKIKKGAVLHIDNFGVPKIYGTINKLKENKAVMLYVNGKSKWKAVYSKSMKNLPDNTWAIYDGSSLNGLPEIGKVRSLETAKELDIQIGDIIEWITV